MLKKYQDFINEGWIARSKIVIYNIYDSLIDIYNNKIVPKIGEVEEYKNHMLDNPPLTAMLQRYKPFRYC